MPAPRKLDLGSTNVEADDNIEVCIYYDAEASSTVSLKNINSHINEQYLYWIYSFTSIKYILFNQLYKYNCYILLSCVCTVCTIYMHYKCQMNLA